MLTSSVLVIRYCIFALIAIAANLGTQDAFSRVYSGLGDVAISMLLGTGVGLITKYLLDKHYIFHFKAKSVAHDTQSFGLYGLTGLITTAIFWGFELTFHWAFGTKDMRYFGGMVGLSIGYLIKYQLDKSLVFKSENL